MNKAKYIKGFDGLRAISILLVILAHLGLYSKIEHITFLKNNWNLISGNSGVMIFFSISGFLITTLLLKEKESFGRIDFRNFFIRRLLRLAPAILLLLITVLVLMLGHYLKQDFVAILFSFFYIYNFVPHKFYTGELGHTWSLGVEEQYYFIWPFVISYLSRIKYLIYLALFVVLVCIAFRFISSYPISYNGESYLLANYTYVDRWFIPACLPIIIGSLSGLFLYAFETRLNQIFTKKYLFLWFALFLFTSQVFMPFWWDNFSYLYMPIAVSMFLLWVYFNQDSKCVTILEIKPIRFIGKISYGLYVYQGLFVTTGPSGELSIQHFPINIILTVFVAIISYYFIETPILKFKTKFAPRNISKDRSV
jgi:peptidoglycan/LPS O-acetylase OafA/YrhL